MCHLGTFPILLVALAVLTETVEGFTIGRTTETEAEPPTTQEIGTRVTKIWPLNAVKLNELLKNEIPSKEASSKSTSLFLSTGAPNETQTSAAYETTASHPAATTAEDTATTTAEATAATTEDTKLKSTYESESEISGIYPKSSFTNTTSTQHETTTPPLDILYTNIFASFENGSISTTNTSDPLNVTTTEKNIFRNIFDEVNNKAISTSEVENENLSTSISPVINMSNSISDKHENISKSTDLVKNISNSTSKVKNDNASTSIGQVKNMSISTGEVKNANSSTNIGLIKNKSFITSEVKNINASTNIAQDKNVSFSNESLSSNTTAAKQTLSALLEKLLTNETRLDESTRAINYENVFTTSTQISNESSNSNNSENVSVSSSQSDLLASDRNMSASDEKFNLFLDHSHFTAEAASSNEPVTISEHISEIMSSISNTSIINSDEINMSTNGLDNSNFTEITKNMPKTTKKHTGRGYVPSIGEKSTSADEIAVMTTSAITTSKANDKMNQDLMTPEADSTSYSSKSVEINDITTSDISLGKSSVTNYPEIHETTKSDIVTENTPYAYLGSIGENEDMPISFRTKFRNEVTENTPSSFNWKKYNVIDRTRAKTESMETTTEHFEILQGAGTAQDIGNTFRSDQAYLQMLENKLVSLDKMSTMESSTRSLFTYSNFTTGLPSEAIEKTTDLPQSQQTKPNVVSSLRAGFLDFSSRTTTTASEISSNKGTVPVASSSTVYSSTNTFTHETTHIPEVKRTTMKTEPERANNKHKSSLTTKSLDLVDDDLEEELMKEEIMSNSRELSWKPTKGESPTTTSELPDSNNGGNELTIRPISSEKPKMTGLYTVSPNYKRLKKIEVQAPKPFVRDPDDNSWRNESLSSRGIVFKANNSTKPFTQVLKNKTESVWNNLLENYNKEQPALRERLEKVAEMRKSKKKKFNNLGEPIYTDYEESSEGQKSVERFTMPTLTKGASLVPETIRDIARYTTAPTVNIHKQQTSSFDTSPGKTTSGRQYEYEDDDEEDYTLPNIDLKKFISGGARRETTRTPLLPGPAADPGPAFDTAPARPAFPERKPTLQYFPPRERTTLAPVVMNDYDVEFRNVVNQYTLSIPAKPAYQRRPPAPPPTRSSHGAQGEHAGRGRTTPAPQDTSPSSRSSAPPSPPPPPPPASTTIPTPHHTYSIDTYNEVPSLPSDRGAYVIKHFRDFINEMISAEGSPPGAGAVGAESPRERTAGAAPARVDEHGEYSDYEDHFRRHVLSRFMDNFNQNSVRFKSEFPLLYNTSVVHAVQHTGGGGGDGEPEAESMAFMRRLYDDARAIQQAGRGAGSAGSARGAAGPAAGARGGPPCDRTVELSPDYELHYYVPEGEEREEFQNANPQDPYRLTL